MSNKGFSYNHMRARKSSLVYHIGALIAVTAWGLSFISTKILLQAGLGAVEVYVYIAACIFMRPPRLSTSYFIKFAI